MLQAPKGRGSTHVALQRDSIRVCQTKKQMNSQIMGAGPGHHWEDLGAESALDPRPSQRSHWEADEIFLRAGGSRSLEGKDPSLQGPSHSLSAPGEWPETLGSGL